MNNEPIWWDTTITLYNKFIDPQTKVVTWYRYKLNNCFWKYIGNKVFINKVTISTNDVICRIPKNDNYLGNYIWKATPVETRGNYFTLSIGDIIVKGDVTDTINEYTTGQRSSDLLAKYKQLQGCIEIQQFTEDTGIGRCCEHYHIKGV